MMMPDIAKIQKQLKSDGYFTQLLIGIKANRILLDDLSAGKSSNTDAKHWNDNKALNPQNSGKVAIMRLLFHCFEG